MYWEICFGKYEFPKLKGALEAIASAILIIITNQYNCLLKPTCLKSIQSTIEVSTQPRQIPEYLKMMLSSKKLNFISSPSI